MGLAEYALLAQIRQVRICRDIAASVGRIFDHTARRLVDADKICRTGSTCGGPEIDFKVESRVADLCDDRQLI
jgi:hypothetical protein